MKLPPAQPGRAAPRGRPRPAVAPGWRAKGLLLGAFLVAISNAASARENIVVGQMLRGHFVQERQLAGFARPLVSEGSFLLVPGTGLIWRGEKPFANTTVITDAGILQLANGTEAMRLPSSRLPGLSRLYEVLGSALSGDVAPLRQAFSVSSSGQADEWKIELTPLKNSGVGSAQLKSMTLEGSRFVDDVVIDQGNGDVDRIRFLDETVAQTALAPDEKKLLETMRP